MENMNNPVVNELRKQHDTLIQILNCLLDTGTRLNASLDRLAEQQSQQDKTPEVLQKWISKQQAMDYLDITDSTYYRWVKDGTLMPRGGAGQDKFLVSDLAKLIEERRYRRRKGPSSG